jgi:hypothetical protein
MGKPLTSGINAINLNQLVEDLGIRVRIWKSTTCPNMKSIESFDHDPTCNICDNNMIDFDCYESIAIFQQQDLVEQFKVHGTFHIDEVLATFKIGISLQTFAKIEVLDFVEDFYELIQRRKVTSNPNSLIDVLKYSACSVDAVFVVRGNTTVRFYEGADFEIDVNGSIRWLGTNRPNDKEIYSVYYKFHPVFRAVKAVHRHRYSQYNVLRDLKNSSIPETAYKTLDNRTYVKLPETWVLKRDYLLDRKDQTQTTPTILQPNDYYDPNE